MRGDYDWLWALNPVSVLAPQDLTIQAADKYARPGINVFSGFVTDPAGIANITLDVDGTLVNCPVLDVYGGAWSCNADLGTLIGVDQVDVRAKATNLFGIASGFTNYLNLLADTTAPTVTLNTTTQSYLADGVISETELNWSGGLHDNREAVTAVICQGTAYEPTCPIASAVPGDSPNGEWYYDLSNLLSGDYVSQTMSFYGFDGIGNRSTQPLSVTFRVDTVAPVITLTQQTRTVYPTNQVVLNGSVSDGGQVISLTALVQSPIGLSQIPIGFANGQWQIDVPLNTAGAYLIYINALDAAGNAQLLAIEASTLKVYLPIIRRN